MRTVCRLGSAAATALVATQVGCAAPPRRAPVPPSACYELRRLAATQDSTEWPGFSSGLISLDQGAVVRSRGSDAPVEARGARWLEWTYTAEAEDAIISAMRRLDEIEGRDTVVAPRDSLLKRAEARWREQLEREGVFRYWQRLGQDSLVIVEQAETSSTVVRLHGPPNGNAAGIIQFRSRSYDPHPSREMSSDTPVVGRRVACPAAR